MPRLVAAALVWLTVAATAANAGEAVIQECSADLPGHARSIAEPWADNTLTFANGAVRLAILDTIEPAAAAFHLLVLSPPYDELGERQCRIISPGPGWTGFGGLSFERHEASYNAALGLNVVLDMGLFNPATGLSDVLALSVTINQATGAIGAVW